MKGKEAAQAARRRAEQLQAECDRLTAELKSERSNHAREVDTLERQVRSERVNHMAEAARLAAEEVQRKLAEVEAERRTRGLSDDIAVHLILQTDKFIMNACRYVSMTTGAGPLDALAVVLVWKTEKDVERLPRADQFIELGVPADGWVARQLKELPRGWRKTSAYRNLAMTLDRAEEEGHRRIHPNYRPSWYPKVQHAGVELVSAGQDTP